MSEDRLLTVEEAAQRLHISKEWLYHHWKRLPFAIKFAQRSLRFSSQGIDEYIQEQKNGESTSH